MKYFHTTKFFIVMLLALSASGALNSACSLNSCGANSIIIPRSQSVDAARDFIGWQQLINRCDQECWYGAFAFTAEWQQNFNGGQLARCLFGNDIMRSSNCKKQCGSLTISGSQAPNRGAHDWLADYFGLPTDFQSVVTFCPRIKNAIFDFNFYVGLDQWSQGLFFRVHFPLVWAQWSLRACENIINSGEDSDIAGYMSKQQINNVSLQKSFLLATDGNHGTFGDVTQDFQFGIIDGANTNYTNRLNTDSCCCNEFNCCNKGKTLVHLADVEAALGWNFLCCDDYHLGLELRGSAPAGNRPSAVFLFEPIIGNGHHWTLGAGLTSHYTFWRGCDDESSLGIWFDANVTHLFNDCQFRSFDFKCKPNSRYALLEQFKSPAINLKAGPAGDLPGGTAPKAQYIGTPFDPNAFFSGGLNVNGGLFHAVNKTTFLIQSSFNVQTDVALKIAYQCGGFEWDLGYNLWTRSKEKICKISNGLPGGTYALKGDAQIYGFAGSLSTALPLSATQSMSDIHAGTNTPIGTTFTDAQYDNPGIDNPQLAQGIISGSTLPLSDPFGNAQTNTSFQPVLLSDADIDYRGVPRARTNRVFTHINYTWTECDNWMPFIGIGGSAEFAQKCKNNSCTISQWAVWLKTGVAFN